MTRVYREPVSVRELAGRPVRFFWRGRAYLVLRVLDYWVVSQEWWRQHDPELGRPSDHEYWRVEASPGRDGPVAVCDLRRDTVTGDWLIARVWD